MSRATLVKLLIGQTLLLVLVAWSAAYFARDEFLLVTATRADEDIPGSASPTADDDAGVPTVRLSAAAQRTVGIELALPTSATLEGGTELAATVLDVQPLLELHGRLQAARHEADAALALATASAAEQRRVQGLYDDDRNASQRALETAFAQAGADAARERSAQAGLAALRDQARAGWGPGLAAWLDAPDGGGLPRLVAGREALLRVAVPLDGVLPDGAMLGLAPPADPVGAAAEGQGDADARPAGRRGGAGAPTTADAALGRHRPAAHRVQPLGPAPAADAPGAGRGLLYRAAVAGLAAGTRLTLTRADGPLMPGVRVPASALVWHAGQPWVYVRESSPPPPTPAASAAPPDSATARGIDAFQRRAVPGARRQGGQWFLPDFEADDWVVVRGAQVLLSEELKYQIRNENND